MRMASEFVTTDDSVLVDRVITSKKLVGEKLPSYGRELVPYFVPGASVMDERTVNVNTDVDALRRAGGGLLCIPAPVAAVEKKQKKSSKKKSTKSPMKAVQTREQARIGQAVSAEKPSGQVFATVTSMTSSTTPASALVAEPWAGPAYVNSPPPSSLPVPSFVLAQQGRQPAPRAAAQSEPTSPLRTGRLFEECASANPGSGSQFIDRAAIEFSLKRILQVA